jgi:hypothetical protein
MPREFILRCSDGHYYTASMQTIQWRTMHIGTTQFRRCAVDRRWRKAVFVNPGELTGGQLDQAPTHRV